MKIISARVWGPQHVGLSFIFALKDLHRDVLPTGNQLASQRANMLLYLLQSQL